MDTCTITSVTANSNNTSVTVVCSVSVSGTSYTQTYEVNATDIPSIVQSVKNQAESFRTTQLNAIAQVGGTVAASNTLANLDGTVIDL